MGRRKECQGPSYTQSMHDDGHPPLPTHAIERQWIVDSIPVVQTPDPDPSSPRTPRTSEVGTYVGQRRVHGGLRATIAAQRPRSRETVEAALTSVIFARTVVDTSQDGVCDKGAVQLCQSAAR